MDKDKKNQSLHLGEILIRNQYISWEQLDEVLEIQQRTGQLLGEILIHQGYLSHKDLFRALAIQFNMVFMDLGNVKSPPSEILQKFPATLASEYQALPLLMKDGIWVFAVSKPHTDLADKIRAHIPDIEIRMVLSSPQDIEQAKQRFYSGH